MICILAVLLRLDYIPYYSFDFFKRSSTGQDAVFAIRLHTVLYKTYLFLFNFISMCMVLLLIETTYCLNLQAFKTHNGAWPRTEVVMTDKDMAERSVFSAAFPSASLQLCLFHTLRSFSREVTLQKMGIRVGQRDALLAIFNAMAVARSEQAFEDQCAALEAMNIAAVSMYFRRNWMPIKLEWVQCFKSRCFTLGETTNNRLESLNGKIKSVCSRFASLHDFFSLLRVLRGETEHSAIIQRLSTTSRRLRI